MSVQTNFFSGQIQDQAAVIEFNEYVDPLTFRVAVLQVRGWLDEQTEWNLAGEGEPRLVVSFECVSMLYTRSLEDLFDMVHDMHCELRVCHVGARLQMTLNRNEKFVNTPQFATVDQALNSWDSIEHISTGDTVTLTTGDTLNLTANDLSELQDGSETLGTTNDVPGSGSLMPDLSQLEDADEPSQIESPTIRGADLGELPELSSDGFDVDMKPLED